MRTDIPLSSLAGHKPLPAYAGRPQVPREPCLSLDEVADRLKCKRASLAVLMGHHAEHKPEPRLRRRLHSCGGQQHLYWLSDFRRWAAHHKLDLSRYST